MIVIFLPEYDGSRRVNVTGERESIVRTRGVHEWLRHPAAHTFPPPPKSPSSSPSRRGARAQAHNIAVTGASGVDSTVPRTQSSQSGDGAVLAPAPLAPARARTRRPRGLLDARLAPEATDSPKGPRPSRPAPLRAHHPGRRGAARAVRDDPLLRLCPLSSHPPSRARVPRSAFLPLRSHVLLEKHSPSSQRRVGAHGVVRALRPRSPLGTTGLRGWRPTSHLLPRAVCLLASAGQVKGQGKHSAPDPLQARDCQSETDPRAGIAGWRTLASVAESLAPPRRSCPAPASKRRSRRSGRGQGRSDAGGWLPAP